MKKPIQFLLIVFCLVSCGTSQKQNKQESDIEESYSHAKIGVALMEAGNYPSALNQLLIAHRQNPTDMGILNNLALAYFYRGRADIAIEKFKELLLKAPSYTDAKVNLGRVYIEDKKYAQALSPLIEAAKDLTYPAPEKTHTNLSEAYLKLNVLDSAQAQISKALQSNRDYCPALYLNSKIQFQSRHYFKSSQAADHAIFKCDTREAPAYLPELYYLSATSYFFQKSSNKAKDRFKQLISKYPNSEYIEKSQKILVMLEK